MKRSNTVFLVNAKKECNPWRARECSTAKLGKSDTRVYAHCFCIHGAGKAFSLENTVIGAWRNSDREECG